MLKCHFLLLQRLPLNTNHRESNIACVLTYITYIENAGAISPKPQTALRAHMSTSLFGSSRRIYR